MSMSMTPTHSFETSPRPDILIVPGGHVHDEQKNAETIGWIRKSAAGAEHVMSVCNGAFLLAQAGLLDGKKATTFYGLIDELQEFRPQVEVVRDQRFVDNGKVITSAGLSSGIDASLYLVSKILGMGRAQGLALHLEYQWDPESDFARASLADRLLPPIAEPEGTRVTMESTVGDQDRWEVRYRVEDVASGQQLTGHVNAELAKQERWSRVLATGGADESRSRWTFTDDQDGHWSGSSQVEPVPGSPDVYLVTLTIGRSEKTAQAASR
jgi:putative intracellular protease/amidase